MSDGRVIIDGFAMSQRGRHVYFMMHDIENGWDLNVRFDRQGEAMTLGKFIKPKGLRRRYVVIKRDSPYGQRAIAAATKFRDNLPRLIKEIRNASVQDRAPHPAQGPLRAGDDRGPVRRVVREDGGRRVHPGPDQEGDGPAGPGPRAWRSPHTWVPHNPLA